MQAATTIRNERLKRGQTLRQMAGGIGIDHGHLRRIETGDVTPGPRVRLLIANHLALDVLDLWKDAA